VSSPRASESELPENVAADESDKPPASKTDARKKNDLEKEPHTSRSKQKRRKKTRATPGSDDEKVRFLKGKLSTSFVSDYGD
jgi:hypothetical protein